MVIKYKKNLYFKWLVVSCLDCGGSFVDKITPNVVW